MKISDFKIWLNGFCDGLENTNLSIREIISIILKKVDEIDVDETNEDEVEEIIKQKIQDIPNFTPSFPLNNQPIVCMYGCIQKGFENTCDTNKF